MPKKKPRQTAYSAGEQVAVILPDGSFQRGIVQGSVGRAIRIRLATGKEMIETKKVI